ncbi:MAG: CDF family Co(II)/Ni(II) efflux transporter DmeF [Rhodospirillaceae bacterium]
MHTEAQDHWAHDHTFGQDQRKPGETRTWIVIALTAVTMVVEIWAGLKYGSMALLADGLHMASHASALCIAAFAYVYARKQANDPRFSYGTGKVNSLAGFASAVLLAAFAFLMAWESVQRLISPTTIAFDQAIIVAVIGLFVNVVSALVLIPPGQDGDHHHAGHGHHHHDHNLKAAYLHVIADALTSVLAIVALLLGKLAGLAWMDPVMGLVGAALIVRWSYGLLKDSSAVLLDRQASPEVSDKVKKIIETESDARITDLHVWSIGPGVTAATVAIIASNPETPTHYKELVCQEIDLDHVTIEVHRCKDQHEY